MKRNKIKSLLRRLVCGFREMRSKTFCIVPMALLMGIVSDCVRDEPPADPFAPTNEGRNVLAYRIGDDEYVIWDRNLMFGPGEFNPSIDFEELRGHYFRLSKHMYIYVHSIEPLKTRVKYSVTNVVYGDPEVEMRVSPYLYNNRYTEYEAVSGWVEFRHISDRIVSGNFEAEMVKLNHLDVTEHPDKIFVTDGTFDLLR